MAVLTESLMLSTDRPVMPRLAVLAACLVRALLPSSAC